MKKALIIANMLFASATVFGMQQREDDLSRYSLSYGEVSNTPYYRPWPPRERENFHFVNENRLAGLLERRTPRNGELVRQWILSINRESLTQQRPSTQSLLESLIQQRPSTQLLQSSLDLSNQNLTSVPTEVSKMVFLEELNLSQNSLEDLNFLPRSIKKLNISENSLKSLGSLLSFPNLEELTLDGWLLKYIPDSRIESITDIHGVNEDEDKVDPEYLKDIVANFVNMKKQKRSYSGSGNKLMLQALGGVCTVKLKRPFSLELE